MGVRRGTWERKGESMGGGEGRAEERGCGGLREREIVEGRGTKEVKKWGENTKRCGQETKRKRERQRAAKRPGLAAGPRSAVCGEGG